MPPRPIGGVGYLDAQKIFPLLPLLFSVTSSIFEYKHVQRHEAHFSLAFCMVFNVLSEYVRNIFESIYYNQYCIILYST